MVNVRMRAKKGIRKSVKRAKSAGRRAEKRFTATVDRQTRDVMNVGSTLP